MTAPPPPSTNSTPTPLTTSQARALLHALLSTTPTTTTKQTPFHKPSVRSSRPNQPQQPHQQTITIDASTRIIGHCNNVQIAAISAAEQAVEIIEALKGTLGSAADANNSAAKVEFNVAINAGLSIMGSKNLVMMRNMSVAGSEIGSDGLVKGRGGMRAEGGNGRKRKTDEEVEQGGAVKREKRGDEGEGVGA